MSHRITHFNHQQKRYHMVYCYPSIKSAMFQVHLLDVFSSLQKLFLDERKADYSNRFQKNLIFDDESLFSEESIEEISSFNQNNYSTTSSTTSGRTSSSISSVQVDDSVETIQSPDALEHSPRSETATHAKAYLINSAESSRSTPSNPGFFSRILNRKLSINTPRNSRTCSMM